MQQMNHANRLHSPFSPSGSERWLACPASVQLEQQAALENLQVPASSYAEEGQRAHELAEAALRQQKYASDIVPHSEMTEAVDVYLQYIYDLLAVSEGNWWVEKTVDLTHIIPDQYGHVDFIYHDRTNRILHIIDYKHGQGIPVEAENNTQLGLYALGALWLCEGEVEEIHLTIVQPRAVHPKGPIRTHKTTLEQLIKLKEAAREAYRRATSDNPEAVPGEKQCRWCKAAGICRAHAEYISGLALEEFRGFVPDYAPKPLVLNTLSGEELAWVLAHVDMIRNWANAVEAHAQSLLETGAHVPGYKLVRARSNRVWRDPSTVVQNLRDLGLDEADLYSEPKLLSPAQVEKLLPAKRRHELAPYIYKPEGRVTIAPITDPRPPVGAGPEADFEGCYE